MKIKYEREQRGAKVFTKNEFVEKEKWFEKEIRPSLKGTPKDLPYMQFLFYNTKEEFKDDQLFEENEIIKIRQNSFEQILEKLETYNLSDTQDDVKGIAFEQFLGTTFRGELGQYFTPRSRSEVKITTGAVVDAVWEAKIGNMGKAIYVFEVQSKGSIDSLILNLKKAQSNAAVQAVVAVADEEQLAKIIQESAGVIDEKSLRTWDSEDVLAVYDALVRAHESINKLALVPESF